MAWVWNYYNCERDFKTDSLSILGDQAMNSIRRAVILIALCLVFSGCAVTPNFEFPDAPKKTPQPQYQKLERMTQEPVVAKIQNPDGTTSIAEFAYRKTYQYDINATPSTPSSGGSFFGWLFSLSAWWIWLCIAFVVFVPGGWGIFTWGAGKVRKRMGQVVQGVEEYLKSDAPQEAKDKLLQALRGASDSDTKSEVSKLKR